MNIVVHRFIGQEKEQDTDVDGLYNHQTVAGGASVREGRQVESPAEKRLTRAVDERYHVIGNMNHLLFEKFFARLEYGSTVDDCRDDVNEIVKGAEDKERHQAHQRGVVSFGIRFRLQSSSGQETFSERIDVAHCDQSDAHHHRQR